MSKLIEILPNVYGVKVPSDASNFKIQKPFIDNRVYWNAKENEVSYLYNQTLDTGNWKILGTLTKDEISFDVFEIVDKCDDLGNYKNYKTNNFTFWCSKQSFRSALPKEIYFENPFEEPNRSTHTNLECENWQTAQENITQKLLILQKL